MFKRKTFDVQTYFDRIKKEPCFICEMLAGNPKYPHHIIYQDDSAVVFLNKYPVLYGYTVVAPREHKEHATSDFTIEEYLSIQSLIYRVAEAVKQTVPTERMYILSFGSQQGNSHVHWHIAPLPPGIPFEKQQLEALRFKNGVLDLSEEEMATLAEQICQGMTT